MGMEKIILSKRFVIIDKVLYLLKNEYSYLTPTCSKCSLIKSCFMIKVGSMSANICNANLSLILNEEKNEILLKNYSGVYVDITNKIRFLLIKNSLNNDNFMGYFRKVSESGNNYICTSGMSLFESSLIKVTIRYECR